MGARARPDGNVSRARSPSRSRVLASGKECRQRNFHGAFRSSAMSNAPFASRPLGTAMVGGAVAMATLEVLLQKNVLTLDDVQAVLKTAQSSLVNAPSVQGSLDGARI